MSLYVKLGCGGVDISDLHPRIWDVIEIVGREFPAHEIYVTSTWEGTHLAWSKHYQYKAIDFHVLNVRNRKVVEMLKTRLSKDYDVVEEPDHVHAEYDPK